MKRVYFVRHGATDGSVGNIQQSAQTPLNDLGVKEASLLAARAGSLQFETLYSSPAARASDTAAAVASITSHSVEVSDLFAERKRPSRFDGWDKTLPEYVMYREAEVANLHEADWKFEDSESFTELTDRTKTAFDLLQEKSGDTMVVSHEYIAKFFATYVLSSGVPTPELWAQMYKALRLSNTGITVFQYSPETNWQLLTWNDHAHFAE